MIIGVKVKQLCKINHFQESMHCDLDLGTFDPAIKRVHQHAMRDFDASYLIKAGAI